ncbi:unnamed protein product [Lymnaea stagnalis]|uniref:Secreted protein n=1 Tax=Lymnaea stagnalis TaxID=6523 RepID=A0AAV2HVN3_LYMST
MAAWVTVLSICVIVCLGEFSALGEDLPADDETVIKEVDTKINNSVETLKEFFQGAKRDVINRVRRSWWSRNKGWIIPVAKVGLAIAGRDESSSASTSAKETVPETDDNLAKVNEAIDFLKTISITAEEAYKAKQNE